MELCTRASEERQREKGTHTFVCGRIEFSDHYERNCRYCGLHSANPTPHRHHLAEGAIFESGTYRNTTVLQSGGIQKTSNTLPISWMLSAFVCPQRRCPLTSASIRRIPISYGKPTLRSPNSMRHGEDVIMARRGWSSFL